jgi:hypothetical protein
VTFLPLDLTNPNSVENVLSHIDLTMQYGEDEEPKEVGASLVFSPLTATLPRFTGKGQAWITFHSFMEQCEADRLPFYSLLHWTPTTITGCATYAPFTTDTHRNLTFIIRHCVFPLLHFPGAAQPQTNSLSL